MGKKEEKTYKRYDTKDKVEFVGPRLAKDPEVKDGAYGKMVRLAVVGDCRDPKEGDNKYSPIWYEVNVGDYHAEAAAYLEKDDVLHMIKGKMALRRYGDDNEKFAICILRAELDIPLELQAVLKERGWVPGESKTEKGGKKDKKSSSTKSSKTASPAKKKAPPVEIPDDDDDEEPEEDEDEDTEIEE